MDDIGGVGAGVAMVVEVGMAVWMWVDVQGRVVVWTRSYSGYVSTAEGCRRWCRQIVAMRSDRANMSPPRSMERTGRFEATHSVNEEFKKRGRRRSGRAKS